MRLLHHGFDVLVVAKGLLAIGEEIGDGRVRLLELFLWSCVCFRVRLSRGVRGGTGEVRIGRRARFAVRVCLGKRDPRNCRRGRSRNRGPSRRARKIRRDSRGDRVAHSDVPHLPAGPPSRKAPRLRTGTPRRRSGLRLRRNGPIRPCPSSRSWRSARRSRAEPSRRRVSDPAESEERAKRRMTLAAGRVCAALRTVTARQTLPKIFRRRSLLPSVKLGGSFAVKQADPLFRLRQRSPVSSRHHIVRRPRRERLSASTRGRRDTTMRIYTPAEVRPEPPPTHPRDAPLTPTGARNRSYPKAEMPTARVPCRKRRGPRGTDRDEACFPRARLPLRPPRDT